jgi:hypothetical protein
MLPVLPDSGTYSTASLDLTGSHWSHGQLRIWDYRGARPRTELTAHATTISSLDWDPTVGIRSLAAYSLGSTHVVLKQYPTSKYPTASCSRNGYLRSESVTAALHRQ